MRLLAPIPLAPVFCASLAFAQVHPIPQAPPSSATVQLPDAPAKQVVQKLCGACHSPNIVLGRGLTREGWTEVVASMISRGAKGSQDEFAQVIDYLARNLPPNAGPPGAAASRRPAGGGFSVGPDNKQVVDLASAARGKTLYNAQCVSCHGPKARGTEKGADLVRSVLVMHDRYGSTIGPFLRKGHPTAEAANLSNAQVEDYSNFLHQQLNDTLRSGPYSKVLNVLTGDPKAGEVYFNEHCATCHSPTGDLAGIASRLDPPNLQQRFLFPRAISFERNNLAAPKPVTVTVTAPGEQAVTGTLDSIDDFDVSLIDSAGQYHSWKRTPDLKVEKHDPYAAHNALLDQYTDKDIHDIVAYLETLK